MKAVDLESLVHYVVDAPVGDVTVLVCAVCEVAAQSHDDDHALTVMALHWSKMLREYEPDHQEVVG